VSSVTEYGGTNAVDDALRPEGRVVIRVLGVPQVTLDGSVVRLGARSMLMLLRLALARSVAFSSSRLRADVWGDSTGTDGAVRVQVTRLREVLGADVIVRRHDGYALGPHVEVDADRFETLCRAGRDRSMRLEARIAAFDEALEMWADGAYLGLEHVSWLSGETVRVQELAEQAIDDRFELRMLVQPPASIIADLRTAVLRQPTRERRVELLATALYRSGRQTDALAVIRRLREDLLDQFGLSPAAAIHDLELQILRQDPSLLDRPVVAGHPGDGVLEGQLRSARSLIKAGMIDEAMAIAETVAAAATAAGDRCIYADALLTQARVLELSADVGGDPGRLIDEARGIARQLRNGPLLARCAMARFSSGVPKELDSAIIELTEPLELLPAGSQDRVDLLCFAAVVVSFTEPSPAALQLLDAARRAYERGGSPRAEAVWFASKSIVGAVRGADVRQIDEWATRAFDIARRHDDPTLNVVAAQAVLRAKYSLGDLAAVDRLLPDFERDSHDAGLSFGLVRVSLCRTTNALARGQLGTMPELFEQTERYATRFGTHAGASAIFVQRSLLRLELGADGEIADVVQPLLARGPSVWHAVSALCGRGDAAGLANIREQVAINDSFPAFLAFSALVAQRDGHEALGAWCAERLDALGDTTVLAGFGTLVIGFAAHYAALGYQAMGDDDRAREAFGRALELSERAGADLWSAYSSVGLANASMSREHADALDEVPALLEYAEQVARSSGSVRLSKMCADAAIGRSIEPRPID
jgi:DNA-binding SARP family transcriptional activator